MPLRLTKPLLADDTGLPVYSRGYKLIELIESYTTLRLDDWQAELLVRVLEQCPPGHPREGLLRYRQVIISIPRQAGKSVIASVLALFGLLQHVEAPKVLGVARNAQQAGIVYDYTKSRIDASDALRAVLRAAGTSRIGITRRDGQDGSYVVLAGDADALQGYPSTLAICDELHVMKPEIFDSIVTSQRAQAEPLLVGITTAGDVNSTLLKRLYAQGEAAICGEQETFGFFCWEASDASSLTLEAIEEANPAVACGRISAETIYNDERHTPVSNWRRYALNVFFEGAADSWIPIDAWDKCGGTGLEDFSKAIYAIDVGQKYTSIVAAKKIDGIVYTSLIARLVDPDLDTLKAWAKRLKGPFVMDGYRSPGFVAHMQDKYSVTLIRNGAHKAEAAKTVYRLVMRQQVNHDKAGIVTRQHGNATTKTYQDGFVVVPGKDEADSCYASLYAIYAAETVKRKGTGIA